MDRLLPPRLPRSTLPEPSPKIWSPVTPPPSVCPRNPQSTHLGSLGTRVVRQTDPEGRRLQSFPLQYPQSLGRLPSRHQPRACLHGSTHAAPAAARWPNLQPLERACLQRRPEWQVGRWGTSVPLGRGKQRALEAKRLRDCGQSPQGLGSLAWKGRGGNCLFLDCRESK